MALWQLMHLGTLYTVVAKCMNCHKAIVMISGRAHSYLSIFLYIYIKLYIIYIYIYNIYIYAIFFGKMKAIVVVGVCGVIMIWIIATYILCSIYQLRVGSDGVWVSYVVRFGFAVNTP